MENAYRLAVGNTISTAWRLVKGAKGTVFGALGILLLILIGFTILTVICTYISPVLGGIVQIINNIVVMLAQLGIIYIGIQRAFHLPITSRFVFRAFESDIFFKIIGAYIIKFFLFLPSTILLGIGIIGSKSEGAFFFLALLCGLIGFIGFIYTMVRICLTIAFILDKRFGPWQAIRASFQATRDNVWNLIGIFLIQWLVFIIASIPLGIGLIWAIPFGLILYGMIYKQLMVNVSHL